MRRYCVECDEKIECGCFMDGNGIYLHPSCFEKYMDKTYGKHRWMTVADDGDDGYYIVKDDDSEDGFAGTGIFYTEFDPEDLEPEDGDDDQELLNQEREMLAEKLEGNDKKNIYGIEFGTWFSIPLYVLADSEASAIEAAKRTFDLGHTTPSQSDADWLDDWRGYSDIHVFEITSPDEPKSLLFDADEILNEGGAK